MQKQKFDIAKWFAAYLTGSLTAEQQVRLKEWLEEAEANRLLFEKVCRGENIQELNRMSTRYQREKAWKNIETHFRPEKKMTLRRWLMYAAAVLVLPLCISYFLFQQAADKQGNGLPETAAVVRPGSSKAILTMANGEKVELKGDHNFELREKDGTVINKDSAVLTYEVSGETPDLQTKLVYNDVDIPRGGEYSLVLSDGTIVFLNAMSSLHYPVNFVGDTREVELNGEAYFQVKKDAKRPFVVKTKDMRIQVLGTEFNVSAYKEDKAVKTTLVQGSVKIETADETESVILKPSQQATFCKSSGKLSVKEVDTSMYIAWKDGMFDIRDWRLEDMMNYLSRWYDIQVFYQNESLKEQKFGCYITRYSEIEPILELLEKTGKIQASLKGNTIVITNK